MEYLMLLIVVATMMINTIAQKQYNLKAKHHEPFLFLSVFIYVAMIFFVFSSGFKLEFNSAVLPYSIIFAICFALSFLTTFMAIKTGPLSITLLVTTYSLIVPTFYGMIFLGDKIGALAYIGIVLIMVSLLLVNIQKRSKADDVDKSTPKITLKWVLWLVSAFFVNGFNSVIQKEQQLKFDGAYKSEFMIVGLFIAATVLFICAFLFGNARTEFLHKFKECVKYGIFGGVANGAMNLGVLILTGLIPTAILFPSISGGGVIAGFVISRFLYKEKLSPVQIAGYVIGTVSVIILNL